MTRSELTAQLRSLSAGTIAHTIGSDRYAVIDRSICSAVIYAAEHASEDEIKQIEDFAGILSFLSAHKDYRPSWCG